MNKLLKEFNDYKQKNPKEYKRAEKKNKKLEKLFLKQEKMKIL